MMPWVFRSAVLAAMAGLSTPGLAGGHGIVMRGGGARMGHAMPPVAGTWHVRDGRSFITGGRGGFAYGAGGTSWRGGYRGYGHVNTAFGGFGAPRGGDFGQNVAARNGVLRSRYGFAGRRPTLRFGTTPRLVAGYGHGGGFGGYGGGFGGYGGYGGDIGSGGAAYPVGGYGEAPLASHYAEPPLGGQGYDADADPGERSVAGVGGPQVIVINNNYGAGCRCRAGHGESPLVYRYGVGTYY